MSEELTIEKIYPREVALIHQIARWYLDEWDIPITTTINRLTHQPGDDVLFQLKVTRQNKTIATGGLYNNVGILNVHPKFKDFGPWVAQIYTENSSRKQGVGETLMKEIEQLAREMGLKKIYLYTFTAESLYRKLGWIQMERVLYKGHDTVVMEKVI